MSNKKNSRDGLFRPQYTFLVAGGADAIDKDFYDSYKTWTLDNQNASSSQKVCVLEQEKTFLYTFFRFGNG